MEMMMTQLIQHLLSDTTERSDNTAVIIVHLYVIADTVSSPESQHAGTVQETISDDI